MQVFKIETKVLTDEELQDERWREILARVQDFEVELYAASFDTSGERALDLLLKAEGLLTEVLDRYGLKYFNPGEPCAIPVEDWDEPGCGPNAIPLVSCDAGNNGGMRTSEEEEAELKFGDSLLPGDLYWARLRVAQAKGLLEDGWQFGLEEPPVEDA